MEIIRKYIRILSISNAHLFTESQPIFRTREPHPLPPPCVHPSMLHLTAEVAHRLAFEEAGGSLHLLRIWCVLTLHWGGA